MKTLLRRTLYNSRQCFYAFIVIVTAIGLCMLLSFACYGQIYTINKDGDTINTAYGMKYADKITTATYSMPLGVTDTPQTDSNPHDFYSDTLAINTAQLENYVPAKKLSLEEKLLLYAQECWNDSVSQDVYRRIIGAEFYYEGWLDSHGIIYHRKPTFEGFIEWLKKK